ncbi:uncharacterized protein HGUI_00314 [Hanseniaspora guilliermondii]|uniref:Chromatin assembly factor 1 subunit Cac1-like C-terminal domain-containing protein n=1 Tax=Hanseniaspora guilliermondii TaxID=56406 RepID=A0A1L0AU80_9ASCO|nr:uncharacterized protein HGUI_00314 [Hanseniaspora guilliermondii]
MSEVDKSLNGGDVPQDNTACSVNEKDIVKEGSGNQVNKKPKRTKAEYLQELAEKRRLKEQEIAEKRRIREKELEERKRLKELELEEKKRERERELEERKKQIEEKKRAREREIEEKKKLREQELEEKKKQKEAEMEEKRKQRYQKEQEKLEKEKLKQQREEENLSKLRISNFFKKKTDGQENIEKRNVNPGTFSRPITLHSVTDDSIIEVEPSFNGTENISFGTDLEGHQICDFVQDFQDFYLKSNFERFVNAQASRVSEIDKILSSQEDSSQAIKQSIENLKTLKTKYLSQQVMITLQDNSLVVFHECDRGDMSDHELMKLLERVPHKYLKFYENQSLPFTGTYSESIVLPPNNPFDVERTDFEYGKDSDYEALEYIDSDMDGDIDDGEEGDELDSEDEEDDDDDEEDSSQELSEFVEPDATGSVSKDTKSKNNKKKTLLIPTIQFNNKEAAVYLDPLQQSFFNENDREYIDSISAKILYPTPININEPLGLPDDKENESKKRNIEKLQKESEELLSKTNENENISINTASSNETKIGNLEPDSKKAKIIITDTRALIKLLKKVEGCPYSKNTMVEVIGFDLESKFSRKIIKETVDHYATRIKELWTLKDPNVIQKLESQKDSET